MNMHSPRQALRNPHTYLLHDASFALGEGDVPTRLVLNEFDINLPTFTAGLIVIIVVIIGGSTDARTLDSTVVGVAIGVAWVVGGRGVGCVGVRDVGHGELATKKVECGGQEITRPKEE